MGRLPSSHPVEEREWLRAWWAPSIQPKSTHGNELKKFLLDEISGRSIKHWSHSNSERRIWDSLSNKEVLSIDPFWLQGFFSSIFINDLYEEIENAFVKLSEDKNLRGLCVLWNTFFYIHHIFTNVLQEKLGSIATYPKQEKLSESRLKHFPQGKPERIMFQKQKCI